MPSEGLYDRLIAALHLFARDRGVVAIARSDIAGELRAVLGRGVSPSRITEWLGTWKDGVWTTPPKPSRDVDVVWAFARMCGVRPAWLAFGEEPVRPEETTRAPLTKEAARAELDQRSADVRARAAGTKRPRRA